MIKRCEDLVGGAGDAQRMMLHEKRDCASRQHSSAGTSGMETFDRTRDNVEIDYICIMLQCRSQLVICFGSQDNDIETYACESCKIPAFERVHQGARGARGLFSDHERSWLRATSIG
jgi:hypothetical protein